MSGRGSATLGAWAQRRQLRLQPKVQTKRHRCETSAPEFLKQEAEIKLGGGKKAIDRQHEKGRLTARERVEKLVDQGSTFQELGLWCAHGMYEEYGGAPAAGVVTGIGVVQGRPCMIIANDATVKAGAFFPMTCKKIIRAQTIAQMGAPAPDLPGGLGGRVPASAGRCLP